MNLKTIRVRITNQLSGQPRNEQYYEISIPEESIEEMHGVTSRMWPDCQVNFKWWGRDLQDCFIYGQALNQKMDQERVDRGVMSENDFRRKWYGIELS